MLGNLCVVMSRNTPTLDYLVYSYSSVSRFLVLWSFGTTTDQNPSIRDALIKRHWHDHLWCQKFRNSNKETWHIQTASWMAQWHGLAHAGNWCNLAGMLGTNTVCPGVLHAMPKIHETLQGSADLCWFRKFCREACKTRRTSSTRWCPHLILFGWGPHLTLALSAVGLCSNNCICETAEWISPVSPQSTGDDLQVGSYAKSTMGGEHGTSWH